MGNHAFPSNVGTSFVKDPFLNRMGRVRLECSINRVLCLFEVGGQLEGFSKITHFSEPSEQVAAIVVTWLIYRGVFTFGGKHTSMNLPSWIRANIIGG